MNSLFPGIAIGIACSLFAWWILLHRFGPKIRFYAFINKKKFIHKDGYEFLIKFDNKGRARLSDLKIHLVLKIKKLSKRSHQTWERVHLNIKNPDAYPFIDPLSKGGECQFIVIDIQNTYNFLRNIYFPKEFRKKFEDNLLEFEEVLSLGEKAYIQAHISGINFRSGVKQTFRSKLYALNDIKEGYFDLPSLKRIEHVSEANPTRKGFYIQL